MIITETSRKIKARQSLYGKRKALKQFVIITPENPMAKPTTPTENKAYRTDFEQNLNQAGLYAYPVKGVYSENIEHSYIVFNMPLAMAKWYGQIYDQQSFILGKVIGENEVEYQLWWKKASKNDMNASYNDKQYVLKETQKQFIRKDDASDFFTTVGKNFKFSIPYKFFEAVEFYDDLFDERCQRSKIYETEYQSLIEKSVSDRWHEKHRMVARSTLYGAFYKSHYETAEAKAVNVLLEI